MKILGALRRRFLSRATDEHKSAGWLQFVGFVFVGVLNTVISFVIYLALLWVLPYTLAYTIAFAAGLFTSYSLNARFVFNEKLRLMRALQYPLVYLFQYLLGLALLYVLVELAHLPKAIAPLVIVVATLPLTFLLSRYFITGAFGRRRRKRIVP